VVILTLLASQELVQATIAVASSKEDWETRQQEIAESRISRYCRMSSVQVPIGNNGQAILVVSRYIE
jgi:hypothetical protein